MSFRTLNTVPKLNPNPAKKFLEWSSERECFEYYDKEAKVKKQIKLPVKLQFLEDFHTIKGFSDSEQTGIYSNEIKFTSKDELRVKTFSGIDIAEGLYNDIRLKIIDAGGKYHKSIYALLDGELVNIAIKGSVVSAFSLFANGQKKTAKQPLIKGYSQRFESHFIDINDFENLKKGATKYTVPNFLIGSPYSSTDLEACKNAYTTIVEYFNVYKKDIGSTIEEPVGNDIGDEGDLGIPF